jgi:hypothetical protein
VQYYYFASTLPSLSFGDVPPWSVEDFVAECARHLTSADFRALKTLVADGSSEQDANVVKHWRETQASLGNAIVRHRAHRRGTEPSPHYRPPAYVDPSLAKRVDEALTRPTPLERERALDQLRWHLIGEWMGHDLFGCRVILGYALQLRVLARWTSFDKDIGRRTARGVMDTRAANEENR